MEVTPLEFSTNGEHLIYSSPDGVLKLWETSTNCLKQEYTPSSHLSSTCSCLSWSPGTPKTATPGKKKKRRSSGSTAAAVAELNLVAAGTSSGSILLYSVVTGDLHSQLEGGHTSTVNSVCWSSDGTTLYSCSSDCHIVEWDVVSSKVKHKWKGDKGAVHSVCLCSPSHLLSAGRSIKLWDLTTRQVVKIFTGHSTEVCRLVHIPHADNSESVENSYFLSAALNDRLVSAWQIDTTSKNKNAIANFSLPDEPVTLETTKSSRDRMVVLAVVTKSGQLLIFEHTLNGKLKKPLEAKVRLQIATEGNKGDVPRPLPVLAALPGEGKRVLLVHGHFMKPAFETVTYAASGSNICLVREDPLQLALRTDTSVSKVKTPEVSQDATVLAPGYMAPSKPSQDSSKRGKRKASVGEMTMEERLTTMSLDQPSSGSEVPTAGSLAKLLTQGLQSQDKKILNSVLQNRNEGVVRSTVKGLPVQVIIPLVQELARRLQEGPSRKSADSAGSGHTLVKWIKMVLMVHTSYLMTFPEILETFSTLYQVMDSRVMMFGRLSRLQGKLEIMLSQIATQTKEEEETATTQQPLLQYMEDSSDEEDMLENMAIAAGCSDSEENWEDLSEESDMEALEDSDSKG